MPATLERPPEAAVADPAPSRIPPRRQERPVFASPTARRARALRVAGWALAAVTTVWLTALVLGAFGLEPMPGIRLPGVAAQGESTGPADHAAPAAARRSRAVSAAAAATRDSAAGERGDPSRSDGSGAGGSRRDSDDDAGGGNGKSPAASTSPGAAAPSAGAPAASTPAATAPSRGRSADAPGQVKKSDPTTSDTPGNSGSPPGAAVAQEQRSPTGGKKTPKTP
jgi:hypothetical protein